MSEHNFSELRNPILTCQFPAQARELTQNRSKVRRTLSRLGCSIETTEEIIIAIDEACQNIIRHAYGQETQEKIDIDIQHERDVVIITIRDYAQAVPADCMKPRDLEDIRPGGLGCHFIQKLMDTVSLEPAAGGKGNILRMTRQLP